ncbi:dna directed rna polymerases i ii and iii [Echinococcus multilocularis]|uniref:DNA-directed RNA polymerases I, II, and III subunit RPABC1 n=2 Tax=Echinococcus TaxID=6209 RepID=U6J3H7_ECHGR|nr:DNA-directed RNA polymerases I, II, and III subunit RPABC1 [Echinococcus granulosus]EUB63159.1 DNA-directed RNA polymerases I, II, and III subunit RPABC1 [Echinococcus granulosus]CDS18616.1 dna directed rna polymerases i ii and iii [Echinococcus granulosus]CUT99335.1 dna directed rna polymerases i ii and iii [Echinococcus multilocularis]
MLDDFETYKLWRIKKTILQMCHDRGYLVMQKELDQTLDEFKEAVGDPPSRKDLLMVVNHEEDPADMLYVFFPEEDKVNMKTIRAYIDQMQQDHTYKAILVLQDGGLTPAAKTAIAEMSHKYTLESFYENELMVNITEHQLVPKHSVLTNEEKKELLDGYRLKESQLPKMQVSDPVARYYGLKRGQVVRINRPSETAGRYITYRIVV